ncbi:hypothetical protein CDAR_9491 [Caerostris darwini]|uniref:Uncharacterized protein n=1 Tax=Caerostris darwini TaxID=1538125 RepID=A0AAV4TVA9_9ARAC|nr:hypothetical protein CDAR_9491 [Caerostris darwini]
MGFVSNHFSKRFRRCFTSIPPMARRSLLIRFPNREHLIPHKRFSSFGHSASRDLISIRQTLLGDSGKRGTLSLPIANSIPPNRPNLLSQDSNDISRPPLLVSNRTNKKKRTRSS